MKFSDLQNQDTLNALLDLLDYDDREPPNWHGQVGDCVLSDSGEALIVTNSWADPRRGTNEARLVVRMEGGEKIVLQGFDDRGKDFRIEVPQGFGIEKILGRMLAAAQGGRKRAGSLLDAIRGVRPDLDHPGEDAWTQDF